MDAESAEFVRAGNWSLQDIMAHRALEQAGYPWVRRLDGIGPGFRRRISLLVAERDYLASRAEKK